MNKYEFFKDFAGPLSSTFAATVAAWIAWTITKRQADSAALQASIAMDKLKFDTMAEREKIVKSAEQIIILALNAPQNGPFPYLEMNECALDIRRGRLYFRNETNTYLDGIIDLALSVGNADMMARTPQQTREEEEKLIKKQIDLRGAVNRELGHIMTRMSPELALGLLTNK
jgi:hypothetical protein